MFIKNNIVINSSSKDSGDLFGIHFFYSSNSLTCPWCQHKLSELSLVLVSFPTWPSPSRHFPLCSLPGQYADRKAEEELLDVLEERRRSADLRFALRTFSAHPYRDAVCCPAAELNQAVLESQHLRYVAREVRSKRPPRVLLSTTMQSTPTSPPSLLRSLWRRACRWTRWRRTPAASWRKCPRTCSWASSGWWATCSPRSSRGSSAASLSTWRASTRSEPQTHATDSDGGACCQFLLETLNLY